MYPFMYMQNVHKEKKEIDDVSCCGAAVLAGVLLT